MQRVLVHLKETRIELHQEEQEYNHFEITKLNDIFTSGPSQVYERIQVIHFGFFV